ncbi:perivitellin-2 31 kDa subunit-like isoform X1 [Branchiostoma floridae]|uniref:Perivitellin-2 31 kDa subunit-like isoform X1 n=2 Tax=Branchiostoma floridae TaxID=7739 RepID=A0A9J7M9G3_BRAFL|nr:perivitellin-2 31 kDa subunit-like isoform X1 [Branchiostoma floridae]
MVEFRELWQSDIIFDKSRIFLCYISNSPSCIAVNMGNLHAVKAVVLLCVVTLWFGEEAVGMTSQEAAQINSLLEQAVAKVQHLNARVVNNQDLFVAVVQSAPRWKPIDGSMKYVSVGSNGVWGVDHNNAIFYRSGTFENEASSGTDWVNVEGQLKQVASGYAVWGIGTTNLIYTRLGTSARNPTGTAWEQIAGGLKQIDVSSTAYSVWGVNRHDYIYRRVGITADTPAGTHWQNIAGRLKFVSTGSAGVWGANVHNQVFYRTGTYGNEASAGIGWDYIRGQLLKQVSSGDNVVWGVDTNNKVYIREGISPSTPTGTEWRQLPEKMEQVEANPRFQLAWGVNSTDVFQRVAGVPLT